MAVTFPFLTSYDPPGTSEGSLDPLGLYQIADQLAMQLVPAVRERMQRIRFLTAIAVGAIVTEGLDDDPRHRDASPYLVWEWLVVEAMARATEEDTSRWGVPGSHLVRNALERHGYVDARSYLKTPRVFGFHGVYKRLAVHLGLVDVHLGPGPNAEPLVDAWARGQGLGSLSGAKPMLDRWSTAVRHSLHHGPPRTKPNWKAAEWAELAQAFAPAGAKGAEQRYLRGLLLSADERQLGALSALWELQSAYDDNDFGEESIHHALEKREPTYRPLIEAIRAYEAFARSLQDAFDSLRAEAAGPDARGYVVPEIAGHEGFRRSVVGLHDRFTAAHRTLGEVTLMSFSLQNFFDGRFGALAEPMDAGAYALTLCEHHEAIQRAKSADGKRPWFDRIGGDRVYIRHAYRIPPPVIDPARYVHDYRGRPIRRFRIDLG